ncbi:MAG: hypothetical protein BWX62_00281 [Bacteroidetes bacterium ADurb.Bin037]|nr:MAG: hypothetical protein BWX62_00281 [Bacteroidetes bacterium ADurb.Bin037]
MSVTGLFLILFLTLHVTANLTILAGPEAYRAVTEFMGTNPFIQMMVPVLALGFIVHIGYSFIITLRNRKMRPVAYAAGNRSRGLGTDYWAARNMLVLGFIILGFLILHLSHFWTKMQWQQILGGEAQDGYTLVKEYLSTPWIGACYILWFMSLWFHINHGFWSAFQTLGLNNQNLLPVLRKVSFVYSTLLFAGFTLIVVWCLFF